jgi:hypothetical protein
MLVARRLCGLFNCACTVTVCPWLAFSMAERRSSSEGGQDTRATACEGREAPIGARDLGCPEIPLSQFPENVT